MKPYIKNFLDTCTDMMHEAEKVDCENTREIIISLLTAYQLSVQDDEQQLWLQEARNCLSPLRMAMENQTLDLSEAIVVARDGLIETLLGHDAGSHEIHRK